MFRSPVFTLLLSSLAAIFLLQNTASTQDWGVPSSMPSIRPGNGDPRDRHRTFSIVVRDSRGLPISGALAMVSDLWVEQSGGDGCIRFESRPGMRFPAMVRISAQGYDPRQVLLDANEPVIEVSLSRSEGAVRSAERSVSVAELSPDTRTAAERLQVQAVGALARKENTEAERLLLQVIELTPSAGMAYNNLGVAVLRQRKLEAAVPWFEKAYHMRPYDPVATGNLGLVRWMQGRRDDAFDLLDKAVALGYDSQAAHMILGLLALGRGHSKQAVQELGRVSVDRMPQRDLFLTVALRGIGHQRDSARSFQSYLKRNPVHYLWYSWRPSADRAAGPVAQRQALQ